MAVAALRLSWEPVADRLDAIRRAYARDDLQTAPDAWLPACITDLADALGVDRRQVQRFAAAGVPLTHADAVAKAFRRHPFDIWGDEWVLVELEQLDDAEDRADALGITVDELDDPTAVRRARWRANNRRRLAERAAA